MQMPDEDGYAVIQKVRGLSLHTGGDIPALARSRRIPSARAGGWLPEIRGQACEA